jgi:flagellar hook assembly protein FlgD
VKIEVFDAQGRRVRTLADRVVEPGAHSVVWDGTDASGRRAGPGVYLYRMTSNGFRDQRRMVLLGR